LRRARKRRAALAADGSYDEGLFERLRALRKQLADERGVPPYVIFGDASLVQMARHKPLDERALLAIHGVGVHKLEQYGAAFLRVIAAHADETA
jgi:ATP-dependent DNA helicase RecQ